MLFFSFLIYFQAGINFSNTSKYHLLINQLTCNDLKIILNSNISYICDEKFNYTTGYDDLSYFNIFIEKNIYIINNSYNNIDATNILARSIIKGAETKFIFSEFTNFKIIESYIHALSASYQDVFITMEWNKYSIVNISYCQWDKSSISQSYDEIKIFYENYSKNSRWKKLCLNGKAYLHYLEDPQVEIINITLKTIGISVGSSIGAILFFVIILYLIALFKYKCNRNIEQSLDENTSNTINNIDSIENCNNNANSSNNNDKINNTNSDESLNDINSENIYNINDNKDQNDDIDIENSKKESILNKTNLNIDNNNVNENIENNEGILKIEDIDHKINFLVDKNNQNINNTENNGNQNMSNITNNDDGLTNNNDMIANNDDELTNNDNIITNNDIEKDINDQKENKDKNCQNVENNDIRDEESQKSDKNTPDKNKEKCKIKDFSSGSIFKKFIKELFGIGNSAGSIISEAIGLLKIFQRISGTKTFRFHISQECLKLFSWALNTFDEIFSSFYLRSFSDLEIFYFICYIIPLMFVIFVGASLYSLRYYLVILMSSLFGFLGFGFGYIKYNNKIAAGLIVPSLAIIIVLLILIFKIDSVFYLLSHEDSQNNLRFSFAIFNLLLLLGIMLIPFFLHNLYLYGSYCFICLIIIIMAIIIEFVLQNIFLTNDTKDICKEKLPIIISSFYSLLFVPSTEYLIALMKGDYKNNANIIFGYIFLILIPSIIIVIVMISKDHPNIVEKYKDDFYKFEIIDLARQIAYAFSSAFDEPWACLFFELLWILLFSIFRPYNNYSEYIVQGGSSAIVIIANIIALVCHYNDNIFLSFYASLAIVCSACLPAIVSLFIFFAFDFEIDDKPCYDSPEDSSEVMSVVFLVMTPLSLFFYGLIIPIIIKHFNNFYSYYHKVNWS